MNPPARSASAPAEPQATSADAILPVAEALKPAAEAPVEAAAAPAEPAALSTASPVIITGMPPSGASIIAAALRGAGLDLGDRLTGPSLDDPAGSFSNQELFAWHARVLLESTAQDPHAGHRELPRITVSDERRAEAEELLRGRVAVPGPWGWKDPHAVFFLDHWNALLPAARWVFVVRRPAHFAWSLLRRVKLDADPRPPLSELREALHRWTAVHERVLAFVRSASDRAVLVFTPDDLPVAAESVLNDFLNGHWTPPLSPLQLTGTYQRSWLKQRTPRWVAAAAAMHRPSQTVFRALKEHQANATATRVSSTMERARVGTAAAPPEEWGGRRATTAPAAARQRTLCIVAPNPFAASETFIQAHRDRLGGKVELLHGKHYPAFTMDDIPLLSPLGHALEGTLSSLGVPDRSQRERALRRHLRSAGVAVVLAEYGLTGVQVAQACRQAGVPLVVHFHGYDVYRTPRRREHRLAYRRLFAQAAALVGVSHHMVDELVDLGAPREKVHRIPCGVDPGRFVGARPVDAPPVFLAAGRFVGKKAPHLSLAAFRLVRERCPDARLLMLGDGPLREACMQLARAWGIDKSVTFAGYRPHQEIARAMRVSRAFIQHSVRIADGDAEGMPVSILEAGASGLPVVSTRHTGIPEVVIDGETGFLVDEQDVQGMAERMVELAQDPALASALGAAARQKVSRDYSMDGCIAKLSAVLDEAIARR